MAGLLTGGCKAPALVTSNRAVFYGRRPLAVARPRASRSSGFGCKGSCGGRRGPSWRRKATEKLVEESQGSQEGVEEVEEVEEEAEEVMGDEEGSKAASVGKDDEPEEESVTALDPIFNKAQEAVRDGVVEEAYLDELVNGVKEEFGTMSTNLSAAEEAVATLGEEMKSQGEQYLRLKADFDNFRKRTESEQKMLRENSTAEVVKLLLPILDNFELARSSIHPGSDKEETINNAYQSIYKQIVDILKGVGVVPIKTAGELFDPELHDAVSQLPDNDLPEDSVKTELRRGFTINGRLLRPAMVQVSCKEDETKDADIMNEGDEGDEGDEEDKTGEESIAKDDDSDGEEQQETES